MDDDDLRPPAVERVRRRAWALSAVTCRAFLESFDDKSEALDLRARTLDWVELMSLRSELEPDEIALIDAELGSVDQRVVVNATWRSEGLAVLAWALQVAVIPGHDQMADPGELANSLLFLADDAGTRASELRLRPAADLQQRNAVELAVHWRLRDFSLRPQEMDFESFPETAWFGPLSIDGVGLVGQDLSIDGVPIIDAPPPRVGQCSSIAMERHQAINWLCGWAEIYSEVDTST